MITTMKHGPIVWNAQLNLLAQERFNKIEDLKEKLRISESRVALITREKEELSRKTIATKKEYLDFLKFVNVFHINDKKCVMTGYQINRMNKIKSELEN